jgi:hypothetical protein
MATLMKEPVILPTSKTTVDLSTIKQHFLSDATDPFNRMPLKIEDVIPGLSSLSAHSTFFSATSSLKICSSRLIICSFLFQMYLSKRRSTLGSKTRKAPKWNSKSFLTVYLHVVHIFFDML